LAALPAVLAKPFGLAEVRAYDTTILVYAALLVGVPVYFSRCSTRACRARRAAGRALSRPVTSW